MTLYKITMTVLKLKILLNYFFQSGDKCEPVVECTYYLNIHKYLKNDNIQQLLKIKSPPNIKMQKHVFTISVVLIQVLHSRISITLTYHYELWPYK